MNEKRKPLKTLLFFEDLCFGGTQKQNLELALRMDRERFTPSILTLTGPTDLDDAAQKAGIPLLHMGQHRKPPMLFFSSLGKVLKNIAPDIILPCTAMPNIWGRIWGRFLKIPVVLGTCRGGGAPIRQHEWLLWRLADAIICNSQASMTKMEAFGASTERLFYIPNGVDTDLFHPVSNPADSQLIVCVARLAADKDHATLIRAFAMIAAKHPRATLRLVGDGPEGAALRRLASSFNADTSARIVFAGACSQPAPHYAEADIFALSSVREGQPNVILEAMSSGVAICATAVGGIPALVEEKVSGLLCPPKDVDAMARNLDLLLANPGLARQYGHAGRKFVENGFSFQAMVDAHQNLFEKLWERHGHNCGGKYNEINP